ncbi:MAG: 30S ribosome-binding factor RbfA [Bacteroidota bacterium]
MSLRAEKVASTIKRIIAEPISQLAREHDAGMVTVTSVRVSPDLQIAKVYLSVFGEKNSPGKFLQYLENNSGDLRRIVGQKMRLRYTPELRFYLDDTLNQMEHIQNLLDQVSKKKRDDE